MDIEDIIYNNYSNDELKPFVNDFINNYGISTQNPLSSEINDGFFLLKKKYKIIPSKHQIKKIYNIYFNHIPINIIFQRWITKKIMRSDSGVIVVTIVTKPGDNIKFSCPEKCSYCPTETNLKGIPTQPKSYISTEPAMLRASRHNFNIEEQIMDRIKSYIYTGNIKKDNNKKKIEVILSGGTWDIMPKEYRDQVINEMYYAFNTLYDTDKRPMLSISEEIKINETSVFGIIGLTIETRPDYITKKTLLEYLSYGITRVQLGGQSTHDDILLKINRGCTNKNMIRAIKMLKNIGLKIVTHWMPDLPNSSPGRDREMFLKLLSDPDMQTDDWKIYPCAVIKSASDDLIIKSDIAEWYNEKTYIPYAETNVQDLIDVCIEVKTKINPWIRIQRLVRDIPTKSIETGYNKITNLRQVIHEQMKKKGLRCKCIRCMEIKDRVNLINNGKIVVRSYKASDGLEYHITYELEKYYWTWSYIIYCLQYYINLLFNKKIYYSGNLELYDGLFGFLRLRIDDNAGLDIIPEIKNAGLIREVHIYGNSTSVGEQNKKSSQHKGIGQKLIKVAEEIILIHKLKKCAIISGIGAREYYKNKCNYKLEGSYMIKYLCDK